MSRVRPLIDEREPDGIAPDDPVWRRLRELTRVTNQSRIANGRMIDAEPKALEGSGLVFTAGQTRTIPHKLGRPFRGFYETYLEGAESAGHVGLYPVANPQGVSNSDFITVRATAAGRCAIWVF